MTRGKEKKGRKQSNAVGSMKLNGWEGQYKFLGLTLAVDVSAEVNDDPRKKEYGFCMQKMNVTYQLKRTNKKSPHHKEKNS